MAWRGLGFDSRSEHDWRCESCSGEAPNRVRVPPIAQHPRQRQEGHHEGLLSDRGADGQGPGPGVIVGNRGRVDAPRTVPDVIQGDNCPWGHPLSGENLYYETHSRKTPAKACKHCRRVKQRGQRRGGLSLAECYEQYPEWLQIEVQRASGKPGEMRAPAKIKPIRTGPHPIYRICPKCLARPGALCTTRTGLSYGSGRYHQSRLPA